MQWQISVTFLILQLVKSLPFRIPEAWKSTSFGWSIPILAIIGSTSPGSHHNSGLCHSFYFRKCFFLSCMTWSTLTSRSIFGQMEMWDQIHTGWAESSLLGFTMKGESKKVACLASVSNLVTAWKLEQVHYAGSKKGVTLLWDLASHPDVLLARHAGKEHMTRSLERPC